LVAQALMKLASRSVDQYKPAEPGASVTPTSARQIA
jgi:hypothetical protein